MTAHTVTEMTVSQGIIQDRWQQLQRKSTLSKIHFLNGNAGKTLQ